MVDPVDHAGHGESHADVRRRHATQLSRQLGVTCDVREVRGKGGRVPDAREKASLAMPHDGCRAPRLRGDDGAAARERLDRGNRSSLVLGREQKRIESPYQRPMLRW